MFLLFPLHVILIWFGFMQSALGKSGIVVRGNTFYTESIREGMKYAIVSSTNLLIVIFSSPHHYHPRHYQAKRHV
jgi:hypothetical protein